MDQSTLMEYVSRILSEHDELSWEKDKELLKVAAEIMEAGDEYGCPATVEEALTDAKAELSGEISKRLDAAVESVKKELELRGNPSRPASEILAEIMGEEAINASGKNVGDPVNAMVAKKILRRQADSLLSEKCVQDVHYFEDGKLWRAIVRFKDGNISKEGQNTLRKMKHNAHRTMMDTNKDMQVITFIVAG